MCPRQINVSYGLVVHNNTQWLILVFCGDCEEHFNKKESGPVALELTRFTGLTKTSPNLGFQVLMSFEPAHLHKIRTNAGKFKMPCHNEANYLKYYSPFICLATLVVTEFHETWCVRYFGGRHAKHCSF